jgi:hypothetical protein
MDQTESKSSVCYQSHNILQVLIDDMILHVQAAIEIPIPETCHDNDQVSLQAPTISPIRRATTTTSTLSHAPLTLRRVATAMLQPPKPIGPKPSVWKSIGWLTTANCKLCGNFEDF